MFIRRLVRRCGITRQLQRACHCIPSLADEVAASCSGHGRIHIGFVHRISALHGNRQARGYRKLLRPRSEEHTSELQSRQYLVCRLLLEKKKKKTTTQKNSRRSKTTVTRA